MLYYADHMHVCACIYVSLNWKSHEFQVSCINSQVATAYSYVAICSHFSVSDDHTQLVGHEQPNLFSYHAL